MQLRPMWVKYYLTVLNYIVQVQEVNRDISRMGGKREEIGGEWSVLIWKQMLLKSCLQFTTWKSYLGQISTTCCYAEAKFFNCSHLRVSSSFSCVNKHVGVAYLIRKTPLGCIAFYSWMVFVDLPTVCCSLFNFSSCFLLWRCRSASCSPRSFEYL